MSVAIELLQTERAALRRAALHLAAMILADASGSGGGGGGLSENGAMLDLETRALAYVRRLDELDELERARAYTVNPARLQPHEGPGECVVCGCEPGDRHNLATHEANEDLTSS